MSWTIKVFSEELSLIIFHPQLSRPTVLFQTILDLSGSCRGLRWAWGRLISFRTRERDELNVLLQMSLTSPISRTWITLGGFSKGEINSVLWEMITFDVWSLLPCSHGVEVWKGTSLQVLDVLHFFDSENFKSYAISTIGMWWSWGPYWFRYIIRWKCFHFYKGGRLRWKFLRWFLVGFVFWEYLFTVYSFMLFWSKYITNAYFKWHCSLGEIQKNVDGRYKNELEGWGRENTFLFNF